MPNELVVQQISPQPDRVVIIAWPRSGSARCPHCHQPSRRVHSRYRRQLADLPWQGRPVTIVLNARRFRCSTVSCPRKIFGEPLPKVAAAYARRSLRLAEVQRQIGLALGGAAGGRLAHRLALPISGSTLLRLIRRGVAPTHRGQALRVIGIDDWAWRRGHRYGTVICDLERRRIIDLLPDRQPATVQAWLAAHPGVEVVARDRGPGYGHAVARACPDAIQVADRWHLMENASAAFLQAVRRSMRLIRHALGAGAVDPNLLTSAERRQYAGFQRREAANAEIRRLRQAGASIKAVVRRTGYSRKVVREVVRGGTGDVFRARASSLQPFLAKLDTEWAAGCRNGAELHRRLQAMGFAGSLRVVTEWATRQRRNESAPEGRPRKPPSARSIARLMTIARDQLSKADALMVTLIERAVPGLVAGRDLLDRFQTIIRAKTASELQSWINDATDSLLGSFAAGIVADQRAIAAAITESWSNGQTEGQITKLKLIKRQMYGRAKIDLLRARLCAA